MRLPSGTRISDPVSTGVAVSRPNSVAFRPSVFFSGMPMTPNIIQTMKHTVKASVLTISTGCAEHPSSGYAERAIRTMALRWRIVPRNYPGSALRPGGA